MSDEVVRCKVGVLLDALPEGEAEALGAALVSDVLSGADVWRVLRSEGYRVGVTTVKAHRRGDCVCVFG